MKPRKPNESDASYIKRLEASNAELKKIGKWAERVSRSVRWLSCDASVAFQAMAEKAGVRSHSSVTAVVEAFDLIAHPQWQKDDAKLPDMAFPTDWDLDPAEAWSGDADMELNAGIKMALEYLDARCFARGVSEDERKRVIEIMDALEAPLAGIVEKALPARAERQPVVIPDDATREDLASVINDMSWRALDLAQDMSSTNEMLRRDLRAAAYRAICRDLYDMSRLNVPDHNPNFDVKVIGDVLPF